MATLARHVAVAGSFEAERCCAMLQGYETVYGVLRAQRACIRCKCMPWLAYLAATYLVRGHRPRPPRAVAPILASLHSRLALDFVQLVCCSIDLTAVMHLHNPRYQSAVCWMPNRAHLMEQRRICPRPKLSAHLHKGRSTARFSVLQPENAFGTNAAEVSVNLTVVRRQGVFACASAVPCFIRQERKLEVLCLQTHTIPVAILRQQTSLA